MIFEIDRTTNFSNRPPCEGATPYVYETEFRGTMSAKTRYKMEIADLAELLEMAEAWGEEIIIRHAYDKENPFQWTIEIYDGYRE